MVGPYRLLQRIGEGGMGDVWLAEQTGPVRRQVALKVIKAGMDTAHVIARFEAERQALAVMDHPAIAKVFDANAALDGRPYFVMEYVRGEPLTDYCEHQHLSTTERLQLFLQVCDGVQHAHQKGVIHRDLKPSNILITILDGRAVPKIIDFGLAKAMAQPLTERTLYTEIGTLVGTPEYMSPEQALPTGLDVDTRTDVYALGVVLYELLTGGLPFDAKQLREKGLDEIRRTIREVEPARPSVRVTQIRISRRPASSDVHVLARELRGDLDWITMRALEKDRTRRYGSAAEFATDIRRHLDHLPVLAGPPSTAYRLGKFARRHRVAVAASAILLGLLLAFTATTAIQAARIARERDRANEQAEIAKAVNDFLQKDLLAQASSWSQTGPGTKPDPDLKVRTALDRAAARIQHQFEKQPLVEAAVERTIATAYKGLGLYAVAEPHFERAVELHRNLLGSEHLETLASLQLLGVNYQLEGKYPQAESMLIPVLSARTRLLGDEHAMTLETLTSVALLYRFTAKYVEAERIYRKVCEVQRRQRRDLDAETLDCMSGLGTALYLQGKLAEAETLDVQVFDGRRRLLGDGHPDTITTMANLGAVYLNEGKTKEAEKIYTQLVTTGRQVLGAEHPYTLTFMSNLATAYRSEKDYAKAEELYKEVLDARRRTSGENHPDAFMTMTQLGGVYRREGKYEQAVALFSRAYDGQRRLLGAEHPDTLDTLIAMARVRLLQKRYPEAETVLRGALPSYRKALGDAWTRYRCESMLGASLLGQRKFSDAEPLLISGYSGMHERRAAIPAFSRTDLEEASQNLLALYSDWHKKDKLTEWRARIGEVPIVPQ
jgi:non-specific serine/threonine protein kinase/serine/threonine-protein kinase